MDFSTYTGWAIPEGNVVEVADAAGNVLWTVSGGKVILEVEKITSDTYAGETTYTGEQFILLAIYPKTNSTVKVTYGGLTKTITDTSGAAEPNAQQVFFGTFNGVSDSVATPASGELIIEGDCKGFAVGIYDDDPKSLIVPFCSCISAVKSFGSVEFIPGNAFRDCSGLTSITIPEAVTSIGSAAFYGCSGLTIVTFNNTSGWYVTNTSGATSGTDVDVTDTANNVTLITDTYSNNYWYRAT